MEEILKSILKEQQDTNELLQNILNTKGHEKDLNDLLTIKEIQEEYNLPKSTVYKMFADKNFITLRHTRPMRATRKNVNDYLSQRHEKMD